MTASIKTPKELLQDESAIPAGWDLEIVVQEQCLSYLAWHETTREALIIDAPEEAAEAWESLLKKHADLRFLAVIDTHTHADHISHGAALAEKLGVSFVMHRLSPSTKPHLKIGRDAVLPASVAPIRIFETPGHTPDGMTVLWGPFLFTGDTILYGDTGRDDLPGGDAVAHCASLRKIQKIASAELLVLPGHDHKGGRLSRWETQLKVNASLTQSDEDFIREASAFKCPAPESFKESLFKNFK